MYKRSRGYYPQWGFFRSLCSDVLERNKGSDFNQIALECIVSEKENLTALKNIKNSKTPSSDRFTIFQVLPE